MASQEELIREAWYAFHSCSNSSTDSKKYEAQAKRAARKIVRNYPTSIEAAQARDILQKLNVKVDALTLPDEQAVTAADVFDSAHSRESGHTTNANRIQPSPTELVGQMVKDPDWSNLFGRFMRLSGNKKNLLALAAIFMLFFLPGGPLIYIGLAVLYILRGDLLKQHLDRLLTFMGSD